MDKPIILISAGKYNRSAKYNEQQAVNTGCNIDYVDAVVLAGGAPVLLPRITDAAAIRAAAKQAHGILFTGGGDVVSLNYGEEPHPTSMWTDPSRDAMELELAKAARDLDIPVLGICRGIQLLNVAAGGTLIQNIPSEVPEACQHYTYGLEPILGHSVDIAEGSLLAAVLGATRTHVNSYHHQCIKEVGDGLRVTARAFDGVAEAMEATDGRSLLAVQWHPEELADKNAECLALFKWIVNEAAHYQERTTLAAADGVPTETSPRLPVAREAASDEASTPVPIVTGDQAVVRLANAVISEAIRRFAKEIQLEPSKVGLRICYAIGDKVEETMTVPKHIRVAVIDRFRGMADLDLIDRSSRQQGAITYAVDGKTHNLTLHFQPGVEGERLFIHIES